MTDDVESHTLALLREIRDDVSGLRNEMNARLDGVDERLETLDTQMMGMSSILMLIHGSQLSLEERVEALENLEDTPAE